MKNKTTTIRMTGKTKEQLDMLFSSSLSYDNRVSILMSILPDSALLTLNKLKKEIDKTGESYVSAITKKITENLYNQ